MKKAWEIYNDSYIKGMKRPEYWGFEPNQAYGANMLFGSEDTNPWANRDQKNAQFGYQGKTAGVTAPKAQIPGIGIGGGGQTGTSTVGGMLPAGWNIPGLPNKQQGVFQDLMGAVKAPVTNEISRMATDKIKEMLLGPSSFDKLDPMMEGYAEKVLGNQDAGELFRSITGGPATEEGLGAYDKLFGNAMKESTEALGAPGAMDSLGVADVGSGVLAAAPMLGKMFGLKGTAGNALNAASGLGGAAMQGFANIPADVGALLSMVRFIGGLF